MQSCCGQTRGDRTGGRTGAGIAWWQEGDLAFRSSVLTQERGDGAWFSDLLGERTLHVFDGRVGSSVQQELHDVGKLTRRCYERKKEGNNGGVRLRGRLKELEEVRLGSHMWVWPKFLNNFWMDCHKTWSRHSCNNFGDPITLYLASSTDQCVQ